MEEGEESPEQEPGSPEPDKTMETLPVDPLELIPELSPEEVLKLHQDHEKLLKSLSLTFGESFSTNLYEEISIKQLKQEYNKTVFEILDYRIDKK